MSALEELNQRFEEFKGELAALSSQADVVKLKSVYIGKKGHISSLMKGLKDLPPEQRKELGQEANKARGKIEDLISEKLDSIESEVINQRLEKNKIDISLRDSNLDKGLQAAGPHPLLVIQQNLEDIFISMGFEVIDGPHVETPYYNFEALNIPEDHPARDMQDTFWMEGGEHFC